MSEDDLSAVPADEDYPIAVFRRAWKAYIDEAVEKALIYHGTPRTVGSLVVMDLLNDLATKDHDLRYTRAIAHRIQTEQSNLTRRLRRWLDMRLVWIEHEKPAVAYEQGRPVRKYYHLTGAGKRMAVLAQKAMAHEDYPDWCDQIVAGHERTVRDRW